MTSRTGLSGSVQSGGVRRWHRICESKKAGQKTAHRSAFVRSLAAFHAAFAETASILLFLLPYSTGSPAERKLSFNPRTLSGSRRSETRGPQRAGCRHPARLEREEGNSCMFVRVSLSLLTAGRTPGCVRLRSPADGGGHRVHPALRDLLPAFHFPLFCLLHGSFLPSLFPR